MTDTDTLYDQAEAALVNGRLDEALNTYASICQIDEADVGARMMLGAIEQQRGNLQPAAEHLQLTTRRDPAFFEAWALYGSVLGQMGRFAEAESALRSAIALKPRDGESQLNLGNALKSQGKLTEASDAYRAASELQPNLPVVWFLLAASLLESGHEAEARQPAETAQRLDPGNWEAQQLLGRILYAGDDIERAADCFVKATELAPDQADPWVMAGAALGQLGQFDRAEAYSRRAIELAPDLAGAHSNLGEALREQGKYAESIKALAKSVELQPESATALSSLATSYANLSKYRQAADCLMRAVELDPDSAVLYRFLGSIYRHGGEFVSAEAACRRAIDLAPEVSEAYVGLGETLSAQGKDKDAMQAFDRALELDPGELSAIAGKARSLDRAREYDQAWECLRPVIDSGSNQFSTTSAFAHLSKRLNMQEEALELTEALLVDQELNEYERCGLHFSAGKICDDLKRHDEAFDHITAGCQHKHADFDSNEWQAYISSLIYGFDPQQIPRLARASNNSQRPIFIVGMPRSGTSLVEQIIASHPQVFGAGELAEIDYLSNQLSASSPDGAPYPRCLIGTPGEGMDRVADAYLDKLDELAGDGQIIRVTDKMPQNFVHLGLIQQLFPGARIVHIMRNPVDTCLSCYFTNFAGNLPYSYDLVKLGRFYNQYLRLMAHWRQVIRLPMLEIQYEDLVNDPETLSRRLIEFCGLPWDDACLNFHQSKRVVLTASHDQVRRPIYKGSIERWRAYEAQLAPLLEILPPA